MSKYKKLYETYTNTLNENEELKKRNELLASERRALAKELEDATTQVQLETLDTDSEKVTQATYDVFEALSENLVKSLKAKNIINMKPEEKDALYYTLEHFKNLAMLLKKP